MCKKPCKECPFKRTSIKGWLGEVSFDPMGFITPHWQGDAPLPCHMWVLVQDGDWESGDYATLSELCQGFLIFAKNTCKMPLEPVTAKAVRETTPNRELVFSNLQEFVDHHKRFE